MIFLENKVIREDMEDLYARAIPWEKLRGKSILITGAYGMIASYLVFMCIYLNEEFHYGIQIIAAVRSEKKLRERFGNYLNRDYFSVYLDSIENDMQITQNVDFIVHAAGLASSRYHCSIPIEVMMPNVLGTIQLLKLAELKKCQSFLLFSTGEIYGKVTNQKEIDEAVYGAVDPLDLRNCYCESKRLAEALCLAWWKERGVPARIARIAHTYGPTMDIENDTRVFAAFVNDVVHGRDIAMDSDGSSKRPFTYLADAIAGYFTIMLKGENGEAYNVCNENELLSIKNLAEILAGLFPDKKISVVHRETRKEKNDTVNNIAIRSSKLQRLGWRCRYNTREGFRRTIEGVEAERC